MGKKLLKYLVKYPLLLTALLVYSSGANSQSREIDSIKRVSVTQNDSLKSYSYCQLGWRYLNRTEFDQAMDYLNKALEISTKKNIRTTKALAIDIVGVVYLEKGNYPEALKQFFTLLRLAEELGHDRYKAYAHGNMGLIYSGQGNYPESEKHQLAALALFKKMGDTRGVSNCLGNLAADYFAQKKYDLALKNFLVSAEGLKEAQDRVGEASVYQSIGSTLFAQSAAKTISGKSKDSLESKALEYYFKSYALNGKIEHKDGLATNCINLASFYIKKQRIKEAAGYAEKSLAISKQTGKILTLQDSYKILGQLDSIAGNSKKAFEHYKLYILYRDSLVNEENTKKQIQAEMQYAFDKRVAADSLKNAGQRKTEEFNHEQNIQRQKNFTFGGIIGFGLMMVIAGISLRAYRQKQKANRIISHQKKLVEEKQKEILDSIRYAQRIQKALLTPEPYIERSLKKLMKS